MPIEIKKEIELEIAHVLFIDIVGYSKLSINEQHAAVEELNRIVRASELTCTGLKRDGYAIPHGLTPLLRPVFRH